MGREYCVMRARKLHMVPAYWNILSQTGIKTEEIHGRRFSNVWSSIEEGTYQSFYQKKEWFDIGEHLKNRMLENKSYIKNIYEKQKKQGLKLVKLAKDVQKKNLDSLSKEQLITLYEDIQERWICFDQVNVIPWYVGGDNFQESIISELQELRVKKKEINTLVSPPKLSFSSMEELEMHRIALYIKKEELDISALPEKIQDRIDSLVNKYYWIGFGYDGPETYDQKHYITSIKEILGKDMGFIYEKIENLELYEDSLKERQVEIISKYDLSEEVKNHLETIYILALMTDERKEYSYQLHVSFYLVLKALAEKLSIDIWSLKYCTLDELKDFSDNPEELEQRGMARKEDIVIVHAFEKGYEVLEEDDARSLFEELMVEETETLKGQVASKGEKDIVKGTVRVLMDSSKVDKLQDHEILVTSMTAPEFVPAMRRSKAIITDEGGITCHAAIVSRELDLPCIIGTRNATKILKDGEEVEMNLVDGHIRKIK